MNSCIDGDRLMYRTPITHYIIQVEASATELNLRIESYRYGGTTGII